MISHHPTHELLTAFVKGELPAAINIAVAAHNQLCSHCEALTHKITENQAAQSFDDSIAIGMISDDIDAMINQITMDDRQAVFTPHVPSVVDCGEMKVELPRAFSHINLKPWSKLSGVSRSRLQLDEEPLRSSLLYIEPGIEVPKHTHKGFELTLILDGSFSDDMGSYEVGDFIWLDGQHTHSPMSQEGCLCYAVLDDAMQFTQGLSKLFNPIGRLIY